ncbi:hypothetical protein GOP47_0009142 [Adiantum capillus-veneris]|uniref:Uncharacterized protein n=1 Tax=Adiantum capillus-veneris TaxID=13818 RepID=A0A9D4ZKD7_ADICA|nr:hypothetical protein GOP47_0009142 [Adiantum capillus-veneris]
MPKNVPGQAISSSAPKLRNRAGQNRLVEKRVKLQSERRAYKAGKQAKTPLHTKIENQAVEGIGEPAGDVGVQQSGQGSKKKQKLKERDEEGTLQCSCRGGLRAVDARLGSSFDAKGRYRCGNEVDKAITTVVGEDVPAAEKELAGGNPEEQVSEDSSECKRARGEGHCREYGQAGQHAKQAEKAPPKPRHEKIEQRERGESCADALHLLLQLHSRDLGFPPTHTQLLN